MFKNLLNFVLFISVFQIYSCSKTEKELAIEKIKISKVDSSNFANEFYVHYEGVWDEKKEAILDLNSNGKKTKGYLTLHGDSNTVYMVYGTSDKQGNCYFNLFNLHQEPVAVLRGVKMNDKLYLTKDSSDAMFISLSENYQKSTKYLSITKKDTIFAKNGQNDPNFQLSIHYLNPTDDKEFSKMLKDSVGHLFFESFRMKSFDSQNITASIDTAFELTTKNYTKRASEVKTWGENEILDFTWDRGIQTEVIYNRNNIVQYYFETHELKGKSEWQAGFFKMYDFAEKRQLHIHDIVSDSDGLSKLIGQRMKALNGSDSSVEPVDNFYLNEAGLVFIYNPGTVRMDGVLYLFLPYKECKTFLKRTLDKSAS